MSSMGKGQVQINNQSIRRFRIAYATGFWSRYSFEGGCQVTSVRINDLAGVDYGHNYVRGFMYLFGVLTEHEEVLASRV